MRLAARCLCLPILLAVCLAATANAQQVPLVVETDPLSPEEQQKKFHLPPGFEIELVAADPDIGQPMNLNFDAQGRLYVTSSVEYPYPAQGRAGKDTLKRFEDRDGDGRYETIVTLLDDLNIPIGNTPVYRDVIAYGIPHIARYSASREGGPLDEKRVLFGPFGFDDTHGMNNSFTRWLDGWIYACHGFRNTSSVKASDGSSVTMNSGNTYRFRPDGSRIEQLTWGQVNPFGLCFDPLGNMYTADCHSSPMYQLIRGAYYPSFGKPHDGLGFGPLLVEHSHGSTGIGGIAYYAADQFPPEYRDTIFVCNPVTCRINHDRMEQHGSTYRGIEQPDFVSCDDLWFRPVDVQVGPDGALYVADFYNCIIGHYEVRLDHPRRDRHRGRIWRISYKGTAEKPAEPLSPAPDLTKEPLVGLWKRLADPNLTVRMLATNEMVDRFDADSAPWLTRATFVSKIPTQRAHGLWVLHRWGRLDDPFISGFVEKLADDDSPLVRVHLIKALAEREKWEGDSPDIAKLVRGKFTDDDPFVRRAAAEALGRHPDAANLAPLIELCNSTPADDTHLLHTARIALRNQLLVDGMYEAAGKQFAKDRAAMARLLDVSLGVRSPESAEFIVAGLVRGEEPSALRNDLVRHAAQHLRPERLEHLFGLLTVLAPITHEEQARLILTTHQSVAPRGVALSDELRDDAESLVRELLPKADQSSAVLAAQLARELRLADTYDLLASAAVADNIPDAARGASMEACMTLRPDEGVALVTRVVSDGAQSAAARNKAAQVLAAANTDASRAALAGQLAHVPFGLGIEIATGLARNRQGAELLLETVAAGKASPQLLQQQGVRQSLQSAGVPDLEARIAELTAGLPAIDEAITRAIAARRDGFRAASPDLGMGRALFTKNCASCHRAAGEGTKIGPDLDGIGNRGLERLLEDVLDPNRNVDPAFRTTVVQTADGQVISGLLLREEGGVLIFADKEGKEVRVAETDVDERKVIPLSPMPANVSELVGDAEFYHLFGYLLELKAN